MRFDEKARESLEAVERLLPDEEGRDPLSNAAASRAYYAVYLAVADGAQRRRRDFTGQRADYYQHDRLPSDAVAWGILDHEHGEDLRWLYGLRVKADYQEDQISLEEASEAFDVAQKLVAVALGSVAR
jgi:uncharacterized protein (UPF0332 family)